MFRGIEKQKIFSYRWPKVGWLLCFLEYYSGSQNEDLAVINLPGETFCGKLGNERLQFLEAQQFYLMCPRGLEPLRKSTAL